MSTPNIPKQVRVENRNRVFHLDCHRLRSPMEISWRRAYANMHGTKNPRDVSATMIVPMIR